MRPTRELRVAAPRRPGCAKPVRLSLSELSGEMSECHSNRRAKAAVKRALSKPRKKIGAAIFPPNRLLP